MQSIDMTAEEFQQFLMEKEKEMQIEHDYPNSRIDEEDLKDLGLDYFLIDEREETSQYVFCLKEGYVVMDSYPTTSNSVYTRPNLNIQTMIKVNDVFLKEALQKKEALLEQLDKMNGMFEHYRLKMLFLKE